MRRDLFIGLSIVALTAVPSGGCGAKAPRPAPPRAAVASVPVAKAPDDFLRTFAVTSGFKRGTPERATPTPDGAAVLFLRSGPREPTLALYEMNLLSRDVKEIASAERLLAEPETLSVEEKARRERMRVSGRGITDFEIDPAGARVLFTLSGRIFVLDRATQSARPLATPSPVIDARWSPDGTRIGYVRGHDLYVMDAKSGRETAVTKGGTETKSFGVAEFVAQEELSRTRGYWFSPAGDAMLYAEVDTTDVERLKIVDPGRPERDPVRFAYPRAGKANANVRLHLVRLEGAAPTVGRPTLVDWDARAFPYLATATWEKNSPLTLFVLDRQQRLARLLAVDDRTGRTTKLIEEHDEAWINLDKSVPRWFADGTHFLWSSERSGRLQLELRKRDGTLAAELTSGTAPPYRSLTAFDRERHFAWYESGNRATETSLARVDALRGSSSASVVFPANGGTVRARVRPGGHDVFVVTRSSLTSMPHQSIWREGAEPGEGVTVPSVAIAPSIIPNVELVEVGKDATSVGIVRPRTFDKTKRYPVIDAAYAGPHVTTVAASQALFLRAQWIADELGAIVVSIDAKGTPLRDRTWEREIAGKLGAVPLAGHVEALEELGRRFPEIDSTRVGVYGWSFGGYFAALAVLARPDIYKVAVAGAPPADWRDYDTCYTERYLGLPADAVEAYDAASLLTYAKKPEGTRRPLLIVHGTADDNVYFLHSLKLVDALARADRPFEFLPLVGVTHMLSEPEIAERTWSRMVGFLKRHL